LAIEDFTLTYTLSSSVVHSVFCLYCLDGVHSFQPPSLSAQVCILRPNHQAFSYQPNTKTMLRTTLLALGFTALASAHVAAFAPGMYCRGGPDPSVDNQNTNTVVNPLYQLAKEDWWFQHDRGCDKVPPKAGEFLELPANGQVTVELAHNRAQTTLSYNGQYTSQWPDGKDHPEDWNGWNTDGTVSVCLKDDGAMHTYNESSAGATAFAISYNNNLEAVTMENLVVFTTLDHTPWKRIATYDVPDLPACPEGGCTCAWVWIPNGCGTANM
jgi:hypothetical protein